jgi:cbb3-type cytochrome oxidase cytochrome c subunit
MRERWARRLATLTCLLVLLVSAAFAAARNTGPAPTTDTPAPPPATATATATPEAAPDPAQAARGREVYASLDCKGCHSIAGQGNPRNPLDGVGGRLTRQQIHDWIVAADSVAEDLSPRAARAKQRYRELPPEQLEALVSYLQSLVD